MSERYMGIDVGAESVKVAEVVRVGGGLRWAGRWAAEHGKAPEAAVRELLAAVGWAGVRGAAATGRCAQQLRLARVPTQQAQAAGFRFVRPERAGTVVSIGGHGFSVLELRPSGTEVFRENSRCSQGTGNFLRQLVQRFDVSIEQASALCAEVENPAPLSGRCPVILKTDMTHLANKGEDRARILAGLYDAVCENVQVLLKPRVSPPKVLLVGGVTRAARIRRQFARFLQARGMELLEASLDEVVFLEALGAAVVAAEQGGAVPALTALFAPPALAAFDAVPALGAALERVRRLPRPAAGALQGTGPVILGFDIGSTGAKLVALATERAETVWESYLPTNGQPVAAAQALMRRFVDGAAGSRAVVGCGVTGSGREIVGSLLATCYGPAAVYVLNEIAAHAAGALHYDGRVDTIFEIGGQDAKYIRLAAGRVVDAAMNEACSAGTGSFIEEQGRKFPGIDGVAQLGAVALGSDGGVSLGQHCSVFMAEVIDTAVAAGVDTPAIVAGLYDSVVQNYLNRVKGSRSVGEVIFCQGMPFAADALAAAVARQTGSTVIVPPNPGTVGALGIALLARHALAADGQPGVQPQRFLDAQVTGKDTFICKSTQGCGGAGNYCRIERLTTRVAARTQRFMWGGGCSLWDKGTGKRKLPDRAPDPFRAREELVEALVAHTGTRRGRPLVALTDEFQLKGLFPFFATFLDELGFDLRVRRGADQAALKRGIEGAHIPFCAPMQQFHGLVSALAEERPDYVFVPMVRSLERTAGEAHAAVCPVVQGSADVLRWDLGAAAPPTLLSPVIDVGRTNLESPEFLASCERLAQALGVRGRPQWLGAYQRARTAQEGFAAACVALGREALEFCAAHDVVPIVVLGRPYTIYNAVLNSNVPAIVREQGALPIPVDCYPVDAAVPVFEDVYWGHSQRSLRAAHQLRRTPGVYSLWCSNYSCGPDSFSLHFYAYIMQGKPFAVIETDGHSGDAGTKTRVEAFLHCVHQDRLGDRAPAPANDFHAIQRLRVQPADMRARGEVVLIPRLGPGADVLAAALTGAGVPAESLPMPDRETVRIGRRHTSGKECLPMGLTLGSLLQRLERERTTDTRFAFAMPRSNGPCRFGVYNVLHKIVLEQQRWADRVRVWSPVESNYGDGFPGGIFPLCVIGWNATDVLLQGLHDVRPVEATPGAAAAVYAQYAAELVERTRQEASRKPATRDALFQVMTGRLFGIADILQRAGRAYAAVKMERSLPTVAVVGEIYVRCDPFANDFIIDKLEQRGMRVHQAPFNEWLEYLHWCNRDAGRSGTLGSYLSTATLQRTQQLTYAALARHLGWHERGTVQQALAASAPYLRSGLYGEAVLTLGSAIHEWRNGMIDGVVNVGPHECMPSKLAETQFFHVAEREGLPSLTIPFNGDPLDSAVLDNFAFAVHGGFRRRCVGDTAQAQGQ